MNIEREIFIGSPSQCQNDHMQEDIQATNEIVPEGKIKKQYIGFTMISNEILSNEKISFKAKGLYAYLFSKPDGWDFSGDRMTSQTKEGRKAIYSILRELEDAGFIKRSRQGSGKMIYELLHTLKPTAQNGHQGREEPTAQRGQEGSISNTDNKEDILNSNKESSLEKISDISYEEPEKETFDTKAKTYAKLGIPYKPPKRTDKQKAAWDTETLARYIKDRSMEEHRIEVYVNQTKSSQHWKSLERAVKEFGLDECKKMVDYYLTSEKMEKFGADPSVMMSNHSINEYLRSKNKTKTSKVKLVTFSNK